MSQHFPIYGHPKFSQIGIFGLKIDHLATLIECGRLHLIKRKLFPAPINEEIDDLGSCVRPRLSFTMPAAPTGVARWFVFELKIQIWVNFGVPWNEKMVYSLAIWNTYITATCTFNGHLVI
jgi:hypothetical protein